MICVMRIARLSTLAALVAAATLVGWAGTAAAASSGSSAGSSSTAWLTFGLELLAFVLVLGFIVRYVVPPLRRAMGERESLIRNSIESADQAKADGERLLEQRRQSLEAARDEAAAIVEQANEIADQIRSEGTRRANEEYERLVKAADAEIRLQRQRATDEVLADVGAVVLEAAERVISAGLDDDQRRALIDETIRAAETGTVS